MLFDVCDLDFDPMILILELDLDIMMTYWYTSKKADWLMAQMMKLC